jgi:hypothetical protein
MTARLVSYADDSFRLSQERLVRSAARWGLESAGAWTRQRLQRTAFYAEHRAILDRPRGSGYWLWKPFIIGEALAGMEPGDNLVYCDAGMEIVADLQPLFEICAHHDGVLLFAGHYDDFGGRPVANICARWTKRDCFVGMQCDTPVYHEARLLDASCIVLGKTARAAELVQRWRELCRRPELLTDDPNTCGLPNLPGFRDHRHDQSILSLIAAREGLEIFRHPSQHGNHAKRPEVREPGEWLRHPYGSKGVFLNSPYPTLLNHHRGALGPDALRLEMRARIGVAADELPVHWMADLRQRWIPRFGGAEVPNAVRFEVQQQVDPRSPRRIVHDWLSETRVTAELQPAGAATEVRLVQEGFRDEPTRWRHQQAWAAFFRSLPPPAGAPR